MRYLKYIIFGVLIIYIGWQAVISSTVVKTFTNFKQRTNYWTMLMPEGRVQKSDSGIVLNEEPIYFELRLPSRTEKIDLTLVYEGNANLNLGIRRTSDWSYEFVPAQIQINNQTTVYHVVYDKPFYLEDTHRQRFMISVPNISPGGVIIKQVNASIYRSNISWSQIWHSLLNN